MRLGRIFDLTCDHRYQRKFATVNGLNFEGRVPLLTKFWDTNSFPSVNIDASKYIKRKRKTLDEKLTKKISSIYRTLVATPLRSMHEWESHGTLSKIAAHIHSCSDTTRRQHHTYNVLSGMYPKEVKTLVDRIIDAEIPDARAENRDVPCI